MHLNDIDILKVGDRIRATDDIDLDHHAYVERGETGTVVAIEVEAGDNAPTVFIRLDKHSPDEYIGRNIAEFHVDQTTIVDMLERLFRNEELVWHACARRMGQSGMSS